jgi:hypothetical protein
MIRSDAIVLVSSGVSHSLIRRARPAVDPQAAPAVVGAETALPSSAFVFDFGKEQFNGRSCNHSVWYKSYIQPFPIGVILHRLLPALPAIPRTESPLVKQA